MNQGYQDETRAPLTRAQIRVVLPTLAHVTKRAARFVADRLERLTRWESPEEEDRPPEEEEEDRPPLLLDSLVWWACV